jgi:hypothetical protein
MFVRPAIAAALVALVAQASAQNAKDLSPALNQLQERQADLRMTELTSRSADVTALRVDEHGAPVVRMDLFFGGALPADEAAIVELLDSFTFGDQEAARKDGANEWSTILVRTEPTVEPASMVHFDPTADLAIEFRDLQETVTISCSMTFLINYNGSASTGANFYWYTYSDSITVTTGPNRNSNADPDDFLYWWNGSAYQYFAGSTSASYLDTVSGYGSACNSYYWKVKVNMYTGGSFGVRAMTVSAS